MPTSHTHTERSHPLYGHHPRSRLQQKARAAQLQQHSYVVSIRTELSDLTQVEEESARLYSLLQHSVDQEIQAVGFLPDGTTYGMHHPAPANGNGGSHAAPPPQPSADAGDHLGLLGQAEGQLILSLVEQHHLDKNEVEAIAKELFGVPVKTLNRLQASGLIEELLERHGKGTNGNAKTRSNGGEGISVVHLSPVP